MHWHASAWLQNPIAAAAQAQVGTDIPAQADGIATHL